MAVDGVSPALAIRSSVGIELWASTDLKVPFEPKDYLPREETKNCRSITFSPYGRYLAYGNGNDIKVINTSDWQLKCTLSKPKAFYLKFSPCDNYLTTWETYAITKDKPEGSPNMCVFDVEKGEEVFSVVQKKHTDWEPSWSSNELLFALLVGGEALFYDLGTEGAGFKTPSKRIGIGRGGALSVGPNNGSPFLALCTPGTKGSPSMCKLYRYPDIQQTQAIACKSFFQADHVEMLWNKRGTGLLLLTSTEVDKSGASYYGNQAVHFMSTKGDTCSVPLSKDGPVHAVKWSPKSKEFVVVYGFMPAKASLYNLNCDVIFNFEDAPRNCAYFNDFGNLLILGGFGNLRGYIEVWDVTNKKKLSDIVAADTTHLEWNPDGETFLTATTAPRLRIGNGFKVWHYSGALLHETIWPKGQELLGVAWQQYPEGVFVEKPISKTKIEGIKSSQPEVSKQVYQPPNIRLLKEGKNPEKLIPQPSELTGIQQNKKGTTNSTSRSKRQHLATRVKKDSKEATPSEQLSQDVNNIKITTTGNGTDAKSNANALNSKKKRSNAVLQNNVQKSNNSESDLNASAASTGIENDGKKPENSAESIKHVNKIRCLARKLADIKKLKVKQSQGNTLELNQLQKISMEAQFLEELKMLKLSN